MTPFTTLNVAVLTAAATITTWWAHICWVTRERKTR